ncbi:MAG: glycosyltransferase family 92 protein [Elusimicrobiota bacterium]|jgi:hypothetical protein|nr:glycosyltransferase family 92 protein [Elusimicrobiota bacterium]
MKKIKKFILDAIPSKSLKCKVKYLGRRDMYKQIFKYFVALARYKVYGKAKAERTKTFENELSIASIVRNEADYIREWIEYHKLVGVEKFYIYDNESDDGLKEILEPYIKEGCVVYRYFPGKERQLRAYEDAVDKYKYETKWLALIDIDEFIVPKKYEKITDFLKDFEGYPQVLIGWVVYGSAGHMVKPGGLVIENFKRHASDDFVTESKPIVNPRMIACSLIPHWSQPLCGITVDEEKTPFKSYPYKDFYLQPKPRIKMQINHYYGKSWAEFLQKILRGNAYSLRDPIRSKEDFDSYDRNEVSDEIMDKYIEPVRLALSKVAGSGEQKK